MPSFDKLPKHLRVGPWSPLAYVFLLGFAGWLLWQVGDAWHSFQDLEPVQDRGDVRAWAALAGYTLFFICHTLRNIGCAPFVSYTMIAYSLVFVRAAAELTGAIALAEACRFPALVMAWITTTAWWVLLAPMICYVCGPGQRKGFLKFNFSWFLLNAHLLNLPLAIATHRLNQRALCFFDLWSALAIAFLYGLFYLLVLDANGMHFYIILTPRPWWCVFVYSSFIGLYAGIHAIA